MPFKTVALSPTVTISTGLPDLVRTTDGHSHTISRVQAGEISVALYEWDIPSVSSSLLPDNANFSEIELEFWMHNADNLVELEVVIITTNVGIPPSSLSNSDLWKRIFLSPIVYSTLKESGVEKQLFTVDLGDDSLEQLRQARDDGKAFAIGFRRSKSLLDAGSVEIGGRTLKFGTEWSSANGGIASPPLLYITYFTPQENFPRLEMKYTAEEAFTPQQLTPSNSLGAYMALNSVYPSAQLRDEISSTQTTIPINLQFQSPTRKSGIAQIGPEIIQYAGVDTDNRQLTNIIRGIVPASFPAGLDSFGNLERIHYLSPDEVDDDIRGKIDLHRLFDSSPKLGLIQYRCVAIHHTGLGSTVDFPINSVKILLFQNSKSNVQIDVGIELPEFDRNEGIINTVTSEQIFNDESFGGFESGLFAGALVSFHELPGWGVVDSFDAGEFILQQPISGLTIGQPFRIYPAPAQRIPNDFTPPNNNNGRFLGFLNDGGSNEVDLIQHGKTIQPYDSFYVWIKRTLKENVEAGNNSGAILAVQYTGDVEVS